MKTVQELFKEVVQPSKHVRCRCRLNSMGGVTFVNLATIFTQDFPVNAENKISKEEKKAGKTFPYSRSDLMQAYIRDCGLKAGNDRTGPVLTKREVERYIKMVETDGVEPKQEKPRYRVVIDGKDYEQVNK